MCMSVVSYLPSFLQFLDGISTTSEVHLYTVPELGNLMLGEGERCTNELLQRASDPNFVGNFSLTFSLPGTLVGVNQFTKK